MLCVQTAEQGLRVCSLDRFHDWYNRNVNTKVEPQGAGMWR